MKKIFGVCDLIALSRDFDVQFWSVKQGVLSDFCSQKLQYYILFFTCIHICIMLP